MKTEKQNVPQLRFGEFRGEWGKDIFKNLVKINQGLQISISDRLTEQIEGSFFYITNEFLREKSEKKYFIENPPESVICYKDDILMTRTGNTGKVVTDVEGAFHNNFFKIAYPKIIEKRFLVSFLNLTQTQNYILRLAGTSTIPDLNHSDFYKIQFIFPQLPEQQKIATFLTAVDKKIDLLQQKKTALEQYKKGVMQQIFSQQLRFKDANGNAYADWEEKRLGDISKNVNYGIGNAAKEFDGKNQYLRITDIDDTSNAYIPKPLTSPEGVIDKKYYKFSIIDANSKFVHYNSLRDKYWKWVSVMSMRSGQPGLNAEELKSLKLMLPCIEEQTKIANYLSALDAKIELVAKQLNHTQQFKKGLLQQLFV